ncbi:MAG: hydroxyethylthiazole kinase [Luteococcus sp.]|uniref:hydroxyethylthiazole kinase n=1 Tax=Luteococcus sp. TaxID=1969402 RepID=UPI002649016A|nr:hydroxyethylthiazole kinase [Luteococcus sp.]MDN5564619.1 hydroxyethylthiazole kinase [Luteococcus sp.]
MSGPGAVVRGVRGREPLVHCLTAAVSMNLVADALLAAGARPMMTETLDEAPFVVRRADALLANLGTLSTDGRGGIPATVEVARELGVPWVLDPAAIGPSPVRVDLARQLLALGPSVVRANASEVLVLAGDSTGGRGADSTADPAEALAAARTIAARYGTVVAISGAQDVITDGRREVRVSNGHPLLTRVTGTGCTLGALTAACCSVASPLDAAVAATVWLGVAGERAARSCPRPGSFKVELVDQLFELDGDEVERGASVS